jgi:hypothetical protein
MLARIDISMEIVGSTEAKYANWYEIKQFHFFPIWLSNFFTDVVIL